MHNATVSIKYFASGSTTVPKPVQDALGIEAGDRVRYVNSDDRAQVFKNTCG